MLLRISQLVLSSCLCKQLLGGLDRATRLVAMPLRRLRLHAQGRAEAQDLRCPRAAGVVHAPRGIDGCFRTRPKNLKRSHLHTQKHCIT